MHVIELLLHGGGDGIVGVQIFVGKFNHRRSNIETYKVENRAINFHYSPGKINHF